MASKDFLVAFYILYLCVKCVFGFNLEPRIPVIKTGKPNSYFGFSVALHRTAEDYNGDSWLLVGAPLDQNMQPNTTRSGALWKCPLTSAMSDCDQVITDGKRTEFGKLSLDSNKLTAPHKDEIKDGQWLGVSVRSQGPGKKAVVCAHRYIRKSGESQFGQGFCYTLNRNLSLNELWEPCRGRSVLREHEEFGFCQVGTSSTLLSDDTLLLGAPGPYTWRGTIFAHDTKDDYLHQDTNVYIAPVEDRSSPVEKYSYLGMSVIGAKFLSENFTYAAGAPRSRGTGQVVIFSKKSTTDWSSLYSDIMNTDLILNGEQFGSSFGYEIASADVNGDSYPDILVGAPFYFARDAGGAVYLYLNRKYNILSKADVKLTGKPESQYGIAIANAGDLNKDGCDDIALGSPYEGKGVVYIHMGHRKEGLLSKPDQIIPAESLPVTMKTFGYALSGGMDLDGNGYPDLLIGAYGSGAVALIRTKPIIDIKTLIKPSKIISNIDPSKQGCERDPTSEYTCFHFETCCIIESLVRTSDANVHHLRYIIEAETFPGGKKYSRVFFGSNPTTKGSNIIDRIIDLKKNKLFCQEHIVYLKNNTRDIQTPMKFKVTYKIELSEPVYSTRHPLPNIDDYPVLNATATSMFTANFLNDCGSDEVCYSDLVITPILELPRTMDSSSYALTLGQEEEIRLAITIDNLGESAYEPQLFVRHNNSLHYIAVDAGDKHVVCSTVNKTVVSCMLENPFKKQLSDSKPIVLRFDARTLEDNEPEITFEVWANTTSKSAFPYKEPIQVKALVIKNAELSIQGVSKPEQVLYGGEVKGESAMKYYDDIGSSVVHTYQIYNEGPWRVSNVRVIISWPHQVAAEGSQGKWLLYPEGIPIVDGEHADEQNGQCFLTEVDINPLNLTNRPGHPELAANLEMDPFANHRMSSEKFRLERNNSLKYSSFSSTYNKVRRKRENDPILAEALTNKEGRPKVVKVIDCKNNEAKCIMFQCVIYKIERMHGAIISIKARLWNSTLIEDDSNKVNHIKIVSSAEIIIPESYNIHQNKHSDDYASVETLAYPDFKINESSEVPLWVIIVSVIVGILVLVLIIILLWYFGFFKRSRPDFTLSGNLEKNHESKPFIEQNANSFL